MLSKDINYLNHQHYLTAWVPTHAVGKSKVHLFYVAEVVAAIAAILILPHFGAVGFLVAGGLLPFYKNWRAGFHPDQEKEIYVAWNNSGRDSQIYIHSDVVQDKLLRANQLARQSERNVQPKKFNEDSAEIAQKITLFESARYGVKSYNTIHGGFAQSRGRRNHMEDVVLEGRFTVYDGGKAEFVQLEAVFDGHHGVPPITKQDLIIALKNNLQVQNRKAFTETGIFNALKLTGISLHELLQNNAGATMTLALQIKNRIWIANAGDSRAFIVASDGEVISLTKDAHVQSEDGTLNMELVGPCLVRGGTLDSKHIYSKNGSKLAMVRSLGDHHYPHKTPRPKITYFDPAKDKEYLLVLVTDGVTSVARNFEIGAYIHSLNQNKIPPKDIAAKVVERSLIMGSRDNLSCLVKKINKV